MEKKHLTKNLIDKRQVCLCNYRTGPCRLAYTQYEHKWYVRREWPKGEQV